jgi:hypothetical protein
MQQGCWLPTERYQAGGRYADVARRVRAAIADGTHAGPLAGRLVAVQCGAGSGRARGLGSHSAAAEHRASLQRLVRALGGRVCGARSAQVCVVSGGAAVPRELPAAAVAVREEWLMSVAETHDGVDATRAHELSRR